MRTTGSERAEAKKRCVKAKTGPRASHLSGVMIVVVIVV